MAKREAGPRTRGEATRAALVEAAVSVFSERGFDGASTREIAEAAGLKQGLLTYHFPNKEGLWRAAADHVFGTLRRAVGERIAALGEAPPLERRQEVIRAYVRTMAAHPAFFRFIVDQGAREDARARWVVDTHLKPAYQAMRAAGLLAHADGEDEEPHAFFALVGAATLIFAVPQNCRRITGVDPRRRDAIEAHAEFVAKLLTR